MQRARRARMARARSLLGAGRILQLPAEILLVIFNPLDYVTAIALTRAHSRFWARVDPATFYSDQQKSAEDDIPFGLGW